MRPRLFALFTSITRTRPLYWKSFLNEQSLDKLKLFFLPFNVAFAAPVVSQAVFMLHAIFFLMALSNMYDRLINESTRVLIKIPI